MPTKIEHQFLSNNEGLKQEISAIITSLADGENIEENKEKLSIFEKELDIYYTIEQAIEYNFYSNCLTGNSSCDNWEDVDMVCNLSYQDVCWDEQIEYMGDIEVCSNTVFINSMELKEPSADASKELQLQFRLEHQARCEKERAKNIEDVVSQLGKLGFSLEKIEKVLGELKLTGSNLK